MRTAYLALGLIAAVGCAKGAGLDGGTGGTGFGTGGADASTGSGGASAAGAAGDSGSTSTGGSAGTGGGGGVGGSGGTGGTTGAGGASGSAGTGGGSGSGASGGTGGAATDGSSCLDYSNTFDTSQTAQEWTAGNMPLGQWGQFDHHWDWGVPTTGPAADHTGGGSLWGNRLDAKYTFFEDSYLEGPVWDLSQAVSATFTMWHWLDLEYCTSSCGSGNPVPSAMDGAQVTCWNGTSYVLAPPAGGYSGVIRIFDVFSPAHPLKDAPGFGFNPTFDPQWKEASIELPVECLRADARVRLRFASDSSASSLNGEGWYVDDVALVAQCQ